MPFYPAAIPKQDRDIHTWDSCKGITQLTSLTSTSFPQIFFGLELHLSLELYPIWKIKLLAAALIIYGVCGDLGLVYTVVHLSTL